MKDGRRKVKDWKSNLDIILRPNKLNAEDSTILAINKVGSFFFSGQITVILL